MTEQKQADRRRGIPIATVPRLFMACVCAVFLLGGGLLGWISRQPAVTQEVTTLYSYQFSADGAYQVVLTPNDLYSEERLGEGRLYPLSLTDRVEVFLSATCDATAETEFDGYYSVYVSLLGYQVSDGSQMMVYESMWPLVERTAVQSAGTHLGISDSVSLDLAEYQAFATNADMLVGARVAKLLTLVFEGEVAIRSADESMTEVFSYGMTLPADTALYSITKQSPHSGSGKITQTHDVTTPADFTLITSLTLFAGVLGLLGLLAVALFTRRPTAAEQSELVIRSILRKHGSRMVRLSEPPPFFPEHVIPVSDIDSLIRLADERQRPVFYVAGAGRDAAFYVLDTNAVYLLHQQIQQDETQSTTLVVDDIP